MPDVVLFAGPSAFGTGDRAPGRIRTPMIDGRGIASAVVATVARFRADMPLTDGLLCRRCLASWTPLRRQHLPL